MKAIGMLAVAIGFSAACGSGSDIIEPPPAPDAITVTTGSTPPPRFIPQVATIAVGGTVTFHNGSPMVSENGLPIVHNVVSGNNLWPIRSLEPDESFDVTFTEAGQYQYQCTIHPGMTGVIAVQ